MQATIDKFGRLVIPKKLRQLYNLTEGSTVEIEMGEHGLTLQPFYPTEGLHLKNGITIFSGEAMGDLENAVAQQRRDRLNSLSSD